MASLFFYTWGEAGYVFVLLISIGVNYVLGILIARAQNRGQSGSAFLSAGIFMNLAPLFFFKYWVFIFTNINALLFSEPVKSGITHIHLPIGISFFTFQAISYLVDTYRGQADVQRNPLNLALYISLFPQLIAGPIVRYHDIFKQISDRRVTAEDFQTGIIRFVAGFGKKVIIANNMGAVADHIFSLPATELPAGFAWLGIVAYTLQIYYDFSGYSDMAIGLGRMFGFHFLENFNYPYVSQSIREFWQRWHISLSSWFRDYLYIPLGGNRCVTWRVYFNLITIFFLCGLWHGASWTFIVWGLFHGCFIVIERSSLGFLIHRLPGPIKHCYTMLVVMIAWIFFRADSLEHALSYIQALWNFNALPYMDGILFNALGAEFYVALFAGILFATPTIPVMNAKIARMLSDKAGALPIMAKSMRVIILVAWMTLIIFYGSLSIISGAHNPFLYFRF
ncbi:MBOAT family O-acyltransferase [Desulfococcaceae bacterium HSG9]|nr:MBOAT family O-acyltransferase [Desulfococcaceae bacterium HSG9]